MSRINVPRYLFTSVSTLNYIVGNYSWNSTMFHIIMMCVGIKHVFSIPTPILRTARKIISTTIIIIQHLFVSFLSALKRESNYLDLFTFFQFSIFFNFSSSFSFNLIFYYHCDGIFLCTVYFGVSLFQWINRQRPEKYIW